MKNSYFLWFFLIAIVGCRDHGETRETVSHEQLKEPLIRINKKITDNESLKIDKYIERRNWKVQKTGTGLRYFIYKNGEGEQAKVGQYATVLYEISLLDGTVCYTSEENDPKRFKIGQDNVESGLHEGIMYLKTGDHAKFIIPSHLGHGLTGDLNKIPPRSVLIVDIKLLQLN